MGPCGKVARTYAAGFETVLGRSRGDRIFFLDWAELRVMFGDDASHEIDMIERSGAKAKQEYGRRMENDMAGLLFMAHQYLKYNAGFTIFSFGIYLDQSDGSLSKILISSLSIEFYVA